MAALDTLVNLMKQQGVYEIYLPFLLTFAIFFALLRKTKIFYGKETGEDKIGNNISIVVSVVAALFVTIFTPLGGSISHYFTMFFTQATVAMVAIIVFLMIGSLLLTSIVNPKEEKDEKKLEEIFKQWSKNLLLFGILLVVFMFANSGGISLLTNFGIRIPGLDEGDLGLILLVAGTGLIIYLTTHQKSGSS